MLALWVEEMLGNDLVAFMNIHPAWSIFIWLMLFLSCLNSGCNCRNCKCKG